MSQKTPSEARRTRSWLVTDVRSDDRETWTELYLGYGEFYHVKMTPASLDLVWSWLHDDTHEVRGLVVRADNDTAPVGLAHYRPFARPLHASTGCFLDDLFVAPDFRGTGAVDALLAELASRAAANGWDVVRWITSESNHRAQSTYERLAARTPVLTYDMAPRAILES
ncbi:MAG: putative acetyltransferase [Pseudonocardiales bacterium]|nr:putative acetyltransferase [Pseudonocardiales bacterium]